MNAAEFEVFSDICVHCKVDFDFDMQREPEFYCAHPKCTTLERRCSRFYCPVLKNVRKHSRKEKQDDKV